MQSVMSSRALRERFAEFYADTEPPGGVTNLPSVIQMYMPVGTAVERPAIYAVVGALKYKPQEVARDIANFKSALAGTAPVEAFMPVVAPAMFATRHINEFYKTEEEYYFAIADVLNEEYRAVVDAGFLIQIDDVSLPGRYRIQVPQEGMAAFKRWTGLAVDAMNHALKGIAAEKVRYHMCWSSQNTPHTDDAPLADLVDAIVRIKAQGYQLEAANVRHGHEWRVWRDAKLADDKILMPGMICHATNVIEHPDYIAEVDREIRLRRRARARHRGHRLRLSLARPPADRLGEAGDAGRGCEGREPAAVAALSLAGQWRFCSGHSCQ